MMEETANEVASNLNEAGIEAESENGAVHVTPSGNGHYVPEPVMEAALKNEANVSFFNTGTLMLK